MFFLHDDLLVTFFELEIEARTLFFIWPGIPAFSRMITPQHRLWLYFLWFPLNTRIIYLMFKYNCVIRSDSFFTTIYIISLSH